ncbi:MAG: NlpC/P60 family protein [Pseudomonadota bacterium]
MRAAIVEEARSWLGTPYRHQAATKGAGCDCLGLLRGVWCAVYGDDPKVPAYSPDWDEVAQRDVLLEAARRYLVETPVGERRPGDVILFRMRRGAVAKHLGICSGPDQFLHAYDGHGVVESRLSALWSRKVVAVFRFPQISDL